MLVFGDKQRMAHLMRQVSTESHYFNKRLADLQNIEFKLIETDKMGATLPSALKAALDSSRPTLIVYSMGTTFKGALMT